MRFLLSNGEHYREKILSFPFATELASAKLLVVCVDGEDKVVGACGIRSMLNIMAGLYVKEEHRGRGLGKLLFEKTFEAGEKRRLGFLTLTVSPDNVADNIVHQFKFKQLVFLKRSRQKLMVYPLAFVWKLAFAFLSRICFLLPNTCWSYIHTWLYRRTLS